MVSLCRSGPLTTSARGLANSFGVFQSYYHQSLFSASSPSTIAWIGTTQGFLVNVVGLVSGRLYDAGHVKPLLYGGMLLNVLGLLAASFATKYWEVFLSLGVAAGLGSGMFYVPSLAIVAEYFDTHRPLAMNISAMGGSIGGILYPVLFQVLVDKTSFGWTCRTFALLNGVLLATSCVLIAPRSKSPSAERRGFFDRTALHDAPFLLFAMSLFLIWLAVDVPYFFLPTLVKVQLRRSDAIGGYLLASMNASSIFGRLLLGLAAVKFGTLGAWQASIGASCVLLFSWTAVRSLDGLIPFVIFFGFFTGAVISLFSPALLVISPDLKLVGTRLGMASVLGGFGFLVGPPIAGAIQDKSSQGPGLSLFAGSAYAAAFIMLMAVHRLHKRGLGGARLQES